MFGWVCVSCLFGVVNLRWKIPSQDFLSDEDLTQLDTVRNLFLGPAEEMSLSSSVEDPDNPGCLLEGKAFEKFLSWELEVLLQ